MLHYYTTILLYCYPVLVLKPLVSNRAKYSVTDSVTDSVTGIMTDQGSAETTAR
jgi:hypothetical protein